MNIFQKTGDKEITDLYQQIRVGMIQSVDVDKATVTIQWLDKSGTRVEVPIPMPFCEQGWGIYAMPRKYSIVLCATRPYEFPVILAYVPPNITGKTTSWEDYKKVSSFPEGFQSGEVIFRNLINKAKCKACGEVSSLADWASTIGYDSGDTKVSMEKCPSCGEPAVTVVNNKVTEVNKIQLGILMYFQTDGKLSIKINDGLSADDGDTFETGSLITIDFDDESNVVVKGIQDSTTDAKNVTLTVEENIDITSKDTKETTEHKLIECPDIELGDNSAITIGQAEKIITMMDRLITELRAHTHLGNLGSQTGPTIQPYTDPQQSEIETTKTKAS